MPGMDNSKQIRTGEPQLYLIRTQTRTRHPAAGGRHQEEEEEEEEEDEEGEEEAPKSAPPPATHPPRENPPSATSLPSLSRSSGLRARRIRRRSTEKAAGHLPDPVHNDAKKGSVLQKGIECERAGARDRPSATF